MEDGEMDVYMQELDKARSLNEKLGLGIGLFQVLKTHASQLFNQNRYKIFTRKRNNNLLSIDFREVLIYFWMESY